MIRFSRRGRSTLFPRHRIASIKKFDKEKLSFSFVLFFFAVFGLVVVAELFFFDSGKGGYSGSVRTGREELFYEDADTNSNWETPRPLPRGGAEGGSAAAAGGREAIGGGKKMVDGQKFQDKIRARRAEMEELIRNISEGMNRNPMIKKIRASREQVEAERDEKGVDIDPSLAKHTGYDGVWQPVAGTRHKFYVYSAFYDDRARPIVRVVAATRTKRSDKVWCQLYYKDHSTVLVPAGINIIRENWNLKYSAAFLTCDLFNKTNKQFLEPPTSLSIAAKPSVPASNQLPVHNSGTGVRQANNSDIGVCVKPLHFHYNKTLELMEFVELNRLLGVSKLTMYNDTVGDSVDCLLREYVREGLVELHQWKLNINSQKEIRTEGLFAALNDCLYRNMNKFKYLMLIDLDEFIIPQKNKTLVDMIRFINSQPIVQAGKKVNPLLTSSYSFQNSFFYLQWPDDPTVKTSLALRTLQKTRRKQKFHPQKQRSKYICIPYFVKEAGNHFIWEFHHGRTLNVPTNIGFLHHYRVCEFGGDDCVKTDYVEDYRVSTTWGSDLVDNIDNRLNRTSCSTHAQSAAPSPAVTS